MKTELKEGTLLTAVAKAIPALVFVFDEEGKYVEVIGGADRERYNDAQHLLGKKIDDVVEPDMADMFLAQIQLSLEQGKPRTCVYQLASSDVKGSTAITEPQGKPWFEAHISPMEKNLGEKGMVVWVAYNITLLKNALDEKQKLINELRQASNEIKTLRKILPICSYCKNVRNQDGDWNSIEKFIATHSTTDLSHGICPECMAKHHPDVL